MNRVHRFAWMVTGLLLCASCRAPRTSAPGIFVGQPHFAGFGTCRVHYVTLGRGRQTLVLVHCWGGTSDFWREQIPDLGDEARLILIDLPGHGQSDKPRTDYTMDFFARAVLAVMDDAHVEKAVLVGHSMGVPVICRTYALARERVAALVAVDGPLRRPQMAREDVENLIMPLLLPGYRDEVRRRVTAMFPFPGTESTRERVLSEMLQTPQYVLVSAMEAMFDSDQPDWALKRVDAPILVINARNPMWDGNYQAYVRSLSPKTDYRVIDGVGHWLMLEEPVEFNVTLIQMLREFGLLEAPASRAKQ